jgi:guanylate kinase
MWNRGERKGLLLVISSTSGGGKSTIYNALLAKGDPFAFSVSLTTRPPRAGEIDGVHYRFIDESVFDEMVRNGALAEWAVVHGNKYGTQKKFVEDALENGKIMIFEIDVQGAAQLKAAYPKDSVLVFIAAPSAGETERRLRGRGTNSEEDIQLRLKNAAEEISRFSNYDYLVINDVLEEAIEDVFAIARSERLAVKRFKGEIWR